MLFDTLFIYQGNRPAEKGDQLYKSVYGSSDVEFPICVEMEIVGGNIFWATACKSTARTPAEAEEIIDALENVLHRVIASSKVPIIASDSDGISVCGLPKFQIVETIQKKTISIATMTSDEEWSDLEIKIRKALHEISGVPLDVIQKDSTIFHIGLDSISILKLPKLIRQFGIQLRVSDILRDQTVRAMAQYVLHKNSVKDEHLDFDQILSTAISSINLSSVIRTLEIEIGQTETVMPVTPGQEYMIRSWQASRGNKFFPTFEYRVIGFVNKERLKNAWKELLKHNSIIRTGFIEIGSTLLQVVFKDPQNNLDWRVPENRTQRSNLSDLRFPPVRLIVEKSKIKLEIHHALYDGISLPLLMDQLQLLYRGQSLPTQELSFKNFVAQSIAGSGRKLTRSKWELYLQRTSFRASDEVSGTKTRHNTRTEVFRPSLKVPPLKRVAQDTGVSVNALLLAAISKIYARRLNQNNTAPVVFGIYLANRAPFGEDLSQLAAPTLNLLPICVRNPLTQNLSEIAKDIQRDLQIISSAEMSCASLADIYEWCGIQVNFFVNILKAANLEAAVCDKTSGSKDEGAFVFDSSQTLSTRAAVVDAHTNEDLETNASHKAYLVRIVNSITLSSRSLTSSLLAFGRYRDPIPRI
jgi:aryl carrier-like protein